MSSKTNPTPWRLSDAGLIVDANGELMLAEPETRRRIVLAVNATADWEERDFAALDSMKRETALMDKPKGKDS